MTLARSASALWVAALLALLACDVPQHSQKIQTYQVRGVVDAVIADQQQVIIDHEDIPDLMPGMSMNFDVPNPAVLGKMAPGQEVELTLELRDRSFRIIDVVVLGSVGIAGRAGAAGSSGAFGDPGGPELAPAFALIDQDGSSLALSDLRGKLVLLDFIYTHCPGPCPILTGVHVSLQQAMAPSLRAQVQLVSISLDPERDTPDAMKAYALARGADLANWSFLTGAEATVRKVLGDYGVGIGVQANGEIEHLVITFLIDREGQIVRRYLGLEHTLEGIMAELEREAA